MNDSEIDWTCTRNYIQDLQAISLEGRIVLGRAAIDLNAMLSPQERAFLLDLEELRNFSILKRVALFGKKISTCNIRKFYQMNKVKYGKPTRLFNCAIQNEQ